MQMLIRSRHLVGALILGAFLSAIIPAPADPNDNAFIDAKTDASSTLTVLSVLNVGGAPADGAGQIMAIFDICEAVEQAYHGEYDKAMDTMLKTGLTTFFNSSVGPLVTTIDAGKLLRDSVVKQVFEPRIAVHYEKYRKLRLADLEAELDQKKVTYKTTDFVCWAEDLRGKSVADLGQDTVKRWIDEELMSDGQKSAYLYNTAQMRIQDAKHDKQSFAVKWWPRFWTAEKPVPFEKTKEYWIETWNAQVVVEGLDIAVKRRQEFARDWCAMSSIMIVVDVEKPIEGLKYGVECPELNWREKKTVVINPHGNYVLFVKSLDMKKFSALRAACANLGGITIRLKSPRDEIVAAKFLPFADMMSAQSMTNHDDKTSMWSEFRAPVRFAWRPDLMEKLNLKFNREARIEQIGFRFGNKSVKLQYAPVSGSLPKGILPLEKYFEGGKIDLPAVLEASGLPTEEALACLYGSAKVDVSFAFRMPDPERDPPDKTQSLTINRTLLFPESETTLDLDFTPRRRPRIDNSQERAARAREIAAAFVASPGTQPKDYFNYLYSLPLNASPDNYQELVDRRIERELVEPLKRLESEVRALEARLGKLRSDFIIPLREDVYAVDRGALQMRVPLPACREIFKQDADALKSRIEQGKKQLKDQMTEAETLATRRGDALKDAARQLVNLTSVPMQRLPIVVDMLDRLIKFQQDAEQSFAEYERILDGKIAAYDMHVERLSHPAAEAAFYLPSIENLQKRALALHEKTEALMKEDIRQDQYLRQLSDLLQSFNAWANGTEPMRSPGAALYQLHAFVTGGKWDPAKPEKHPVPAMVSGIENAIKAAITPEVEIIQESATVKERLRNQKNAVTRMSDDISPLLALYVQDIPSGAIRESIKTLGRLDERALLDPALKRIEILKRKWAADEKPPAGSGRQAERAFWVLCCGRQLDVLMTLTEPDIMSRGDGKAKEWIAKYNALLTKANGISAGSHLQDSLNWIKQTEELGRELPELTQSPWPDRCEAAWIANYELPYAGDTLATNMVAAWIGAMDALDKKMRKDIKALPALSPDRRETEKTRLVAIANDSFWNALGLQPLAGTTIGNSIYYGCYQARHTADVYAPAHEKWSRLQTDWHTALKGAVSASAAAPSPPPAQAIDAEGPPAAGVETDTHAELTKAQNELFKLMAEGKGGTPEGQAAYRKMMQARERYEKSLK